MKKFSLLIALFVASGLSACGDDHDDDHDNNHAHGEEVTPQEEACEHMADGPAESATGAVDQATAPNATFEHTRVDLALVDDGNGEFVGNVNYEAAEAAEYYLFANNGAAFSILDSSGNEVEIESTNADFTECTDVAVEYLFDLEVGTYTFVFGPGTDDAVSYVVEQAGGHEEHEEHDEHSE